MKSTREHNGVVLFPLLVFVSNVVMINCRRESNLFVSKKRDNVSFSTYVDYDGSDMWALLRRIHRFTPPGIVSSFSQSLEPFVVIKCKSVVINNYRFPIALNSPYLIHSSDPVKCFWVGLRMITRQELGIIRESPLDLTI